MAQESKDPKEKVITVELAESIADAQLAYINNKVKEAKESVQGEMLEAASSDEVQDILDKFKVEASV